MFLWNCSNFTSLSTVENEKCNPWEEATLQPLLKAKKSVPGCLVTVTDESGQLSFVTALLQSNGELWGEQGETYSSTASVTTPVPSSSKEDGSFHLLFYGFLDGSAKVSDVRTRCTDLAKTLKGEDATLWSCLTASSSRCAFFLSLKPKESLGKPFEILQIKENGIASVKGASCQLHIAGVSGPEVNRDGGNEVKGKEEPTLQEEKFTQPEKIPEIPENTKPELVPDNSSLTPTKLGPLTGPVRLKAFDTKGQPGISTCTCAPFYEFETQSFFPTSSQPLTTPAGFRPTFVTYSYDYKTLLFGFTRKVKHATQDNTILYIATRTDIEKPFLNFKSFSGIKEELVKIRFVRPYFIPKVTNEPKEQFALLIFKRQIQMHDLEDLIQASQDKSPQIPKPSWLVQNPTTETKGQLVDAVALSPELVVSGYFNPDNQMGEIKLWFYDEDKKSVTPIFFTQLENIQTLDVDATRSYLFAGGQDSKTKLASLTIFGLTQDEKLSKLTGTMTVSFDAPSSYVTSLSVALENDSIALGTSPRFDQRLGSYPASTGHGRLFSLETKFIANSKVKPNQHPKGTSWQGKPYIMALGLRDDADGLYLLLPGSSGTSGDKAKALSWYNEPGDEGHASGLYKYQNNQSFEPTGVSLATGPCTEMHVLLEGKFALLRLKQTCDE